MKRVVKMGFFSIASGLFFAFAGVAMLLFQDGIVGALIAVPIAIIVIGGILAVSGILLLAGRLIGRKGSAFAKEIANGDKYIDVIDSDERNIAIRHKTAATTFEYTNWLNPLLLTFMVFMQVELVVTLVFLAIMVVKAIMHFFLLHKYNKEM